MSFKFLVGSYGSFITALSFVLAPGGQSGTLSYITQTSGPYNPSWIAFHPTNSSVLYVNSENSYGTLNSYVLNPSTGSLTSKGSVYSGGASPAHFAPLSNGNEVYVTNYEGSNGLSVNLGADLVSLTGTGPVNTFTGSGPNSSRQSKPHPHQVVEYGNELLVPDLGADKVWRLTKSSTWTISGSIAHPAGSGPRHIATLGSTLYTLHELSNTLTQHTLPALGSGTNPQLVATLPVIPPGASNTTLGAGELLLSPINSAYTSQYLYATNRNDPDSAGDSIAIFSVSPSLQLVKHVRTGLKHIRAAALAGANKEYLVAGGLNGGGIVVYKRINGGQDLLELARLTNQVNQPTSFAFY